MIKTSFAKVISFLLVLTMVFCMIPAVSAADKDEDTSVVYEGTTLVSANKNLEGVYIVKDGTTKIADNAFKDCKKLTRVILSEECVSLGSNAFAGCDSLEILRAYDALTDIGENALGEKRDDYYVICYEGTALYEYGREHKFSLHVPKYTENGIEYIFYQSRVMVTGPADKSIEHVNVFPQIDSTWASYVLDGAFRNCKSLKSVFLSSACFETGERTFENCTNLNSVKIENDSIYFGKDAFKNTAASNDPENTFEGVLYIDDFAVSADKNIEGEVHILHGTRIIAKEAFKDCKKLESIIIPEGVEAIGEKAFENCESLTYLRFPRSLKSIFNNAFDGASKNLTVCSFDNFFADGFGFKYVDAMQYEVYSEEYDITMYFDDNVTFEIEELPLSDFDGLDTAFGSTEVKKLYKIRFVDAYSGRYIKPAQSLIYTIFPMNYDGYFLLSNDENSETTESRYSLTRIDVIEQTESYASLRFNTTDEVLFAGVDFGYYSTTDEATGATFELPYGYEIADVTVTCRQDDLEKLENYFDNNAKGGEAALHYKITESENDKIKKLPQFFVIKMKIPAPSEYAFAYSLAKGPEIIKSKVADGYMELDVLYYEFINLPIVICTLDEALVTPDTPNDEDTTNPSNPVNPTNPTTPLPEYPYYHIGDVNRDGKINIRDATLIQKHLAKMVDLDYTQEYELADFNQDLKVNIKDATAIQKKIANLI